MEHDDLVWLIPVLENVKRKIEKEKLTHDIIGGKIRGTCSVCHGKPVSRNELCEDADRHRKEKLGSVLRGGDVLREVVWELYLRDPQKQRDLLEFINYNRVS